MKKILILFFALVVVLSFSAYADTYVFYDEFDTDNFASKENVSVENSEAVFAGNNAKAELNLYTGDSSNPGIDVSESGTITIEMKLTVTSTGYLPKLPEFLGRTSTAGEPVTVTLGDVPFSNKFCIDSVSTGLTPKAGVTYDFKYELDLLNNEAWLTITDEEGTEYKNKNAKKLKIGENKLLWLDKIVFDSYKNSSMAFKVDYIRISDGSFKIMSLNVAEKDVVAIDKDIVFKLNGDVNEETLKNITVMCGEDSIEYEISKKESGEYVIYFPYGLSYNKNYILTIPKTILSEGSNLSLYERTVNFRTEMHPYYVKNIALSETDLSGKTLVNLEGVFVNNMAADVDASIMVIIYNQSGAIVNTYYKTHTATKGGESTVSGTIDLSGTTNAKTAKIYVWDNLFGMNDVIIAD